MPSTSSGEQLYLSTTPGLGAALAEEAAALGFTVDTVEATGVEVSGPALAHQHACLQLRCANHVLLRLARGPASSAAQVGGLLSRAVLAGVWDGRRALRWQVTTHQSRLAPGAVIEALRRAHPAPAAGDASADVLELQVRLERDEATVSVDCSGEPLYKRGYRQEISRAPMRETLAAGMLRLAGYDPQRPLWDPMCGSGTLPIEAASLALQRAPGAQRAFAFEQFPAFSPVAWERLHTEARAAERTVAPAWIRGTDIHAGSLGVARRNAKRAGVLGALQLERVDATKLPAPAGAPATTGLVVANLPYGKRVNEQVDLRALYRGFGAALLQHFRGWRVALLLEDETLGKAIGLDPEQRIPLENGGLHCALWVCTIRPAR